MATENDPHPEQSGARNRISTYLLTGLIALLILALLIFGVVELVTHSLGTHHPWTGRLRQ